MPQRSRRAAAAAGIAKRKAFTRPSMACMNLLWQKLRSDNMRGVITTSPANNNLNPNNTELSWRCFIDLYRESGRHGINHSNVEVYIQFVCEFVNRVNNRNAFGQIPICAVKEASFFTNYFQSFLMGRNTHATSEQLTDDGLGPANFLQLRHLFIPDRTTKGHMALIVISPVVRTVDYLDSCIVRNDQKMGIVFSMLSEHLGDLFFPYEWKVRQGRCPSQGNTPDCAIYTATNAIFIAFGYPINYAGCNMLNRRYTMASELLNGKNGMFHHPAPGAPIVLEQVQFHYELTDYWAGSRANDRSRGFQSLNQTMLDVLPEEVRARRGMYAHVKTEQEMEDIVASTPTYAWYESLETSAIHLRSSTGF